MKSLVALIMLFLTSFGMQAQDLAYAKEVVKKLASPEFYGRGYVNAGDRLAATYISKEFKRLGLKSFHSTYQQQFNTPVNTFPGTMQLRLGDTLLSSGRDYLIEAGAPGSKGTFSTVTLSIDDMFDRQVLSTKVGTAQGKFIIISPYKAEDYDKDQLEQIRGIVNFLKFHPDNPAAGTIELTFNKLTWTASTIRYTKPAFTVKVDKDVELNTQEISLNIENEFYEQYTTQNVIGYVEGKNTDSLIVLTAHYDHLGMMGASARFPGANDNASGIAMLLNMAQHYTAEQPAYTTVFMAFGAEELGLLGAKHFVENPLFSLEQIKFLINFDISGTGDDGIQVVNGKVYPDKFEQLVEINKAKDLLPQVKNRGEACNSDHCMFHSKGVPCFYIYTLGGIQAYHDIYDKSETLPLSAFENYFRLLTLFIKALD